MTKQIFKKKRKLNKILKGIAITVNFGVIIGLGVIGTIIGTDPVLLIGLGNVLAMLCNAMTKNIPEQITDAKENLVELLADSPDQINTVLDELTTQAEQITARTHAISIPDVPNTARTVEINNNEPCETPIENLEMVQGTIYLNPRTGMYKAVVPE